MKDANLGIDIELSEVLNSIFGKRFVYNNVLTAATGFVRGSYQATCEYAYNYVFLFTMNDTSLNVINDFLNSTFRRRMKAKGIDIDIILHIKQKCIHCKLYKHE